MEESAAPERRPDASHSGMSFLPFAGTPRATPFPVSESPLMTTRVYLVRHGQTALNVEDRFRGRLDPPLDAEGLRQAEAAGRRLLVDPPVRVYSSPMTRARQTADVMAAPLGQRPTVLADLVDLDYGEWTGLTREEAERLDRDSFRALLSSPAEAVTPRGEPLGAVAERMSTALSAMRDAFPDQTLVAVTHEVPIRLLVSRAARLEGGLMWDLLLPPGCIVRLDLNGEDLHLASPRPVFVNRRWPGAHDDEETRPPATTPTRPA